LPAGIAFLALGLVHIGGWKAIRMVNNFPLRARRTVIPALRHHIRLRAVARRSVNNSVDNNQ
jgi:hypothetical protein